jgi:hypothetical protein
MRSELRAPDPIRNLQRVICRTRLPPVVLASVGSAPLTDATDHADASDGDSAPIASILRSKLMAWPAGSG